mgnify:CR=1 FL=1
MTSSRLLIVLVALVAILASFMYYLFVNSKPKEISFVDKNASYEAFESNQSAQNISINLNDKTKPQQNPTPKNADKKGVSKDLKKANSGANSSKNLNANANSSTNLNDEFSAQSSLRAEFDALMARAKRDKRLGEPRYKVYLLNAQHLNAREKAAINELVRTLSRRGGYLHYVLFVDELSEQGAKLYLFNESLLDTQKWLTRKLALPHLWFKFNQNSMQSVKNSFHIKELKANIDTAAIRSAQMNGHTDEIGGEFYNTLLGLQRSAAVASEFLRQTGKITLQSFGKQKPITQGLSENERYKNRRVEVVFE